MEWGTEARAVFDEAVRVIPGILACKQRADHAGSRVLANSVLELANEHGVPPCVTWSIMFSACLHWLQQTTLSLAVGREISMEEMLREMTELAAVWQSDGV